MKRSFIFLSFILFTIFFVAANPQKQRLQNDDGKERPHSLNRMSQFRSRKIPSISQPSPSEWARFYDEDGQAEIFSLLPTADGGCIITGWTWPAEDPHDWLLKLYPNGEVEFKLEDLSYSEIYSVQPTSDGGYIAAGRKRTDFGLFGFDSVVTKLSSQFEIEWSRYYSKPYSDLAKFACQTADGGYIVAARTQLEEYALDPSDLGVFKLSSTGDIEWQYAYGGDQYELSDFFFTSTIMQTINGGYILGGVTNSFGAGGTDLWLLKLAASGAVEWQKTYGGVNDEWFMLGGAHIQLTSDGGYIVAGTTSSFGAGSADVWVFKLFSDGEIDWQYTYGGEFTDSINSIRPTNDGKYILAGYTASFGPEQGNGGGWLLKISDTGVVEWQKSYGGEFQDYFVNVQQTIDGGYVAAGGTWSFTGDSYADVFVVKVGSDGTLGPGDGLIKVRNTGAVPSITSAFTSDTNISPQDIGAVSGGVDIPPEEGNVSSCLLAWDLNQPPANIAFKSEINRGVFKGEKLNTVTWEPDPYNSTFNINEYRIYKKLAEDSFRSFEEIERVSSSAFEFEEHILDISDFDEEIDYAITSVDSNGNESPKSVPVCSASNVNITYQSDNESSRSTESKSSENRILSPNKRIIQKYPESRQNNSIILKSDNSSLRSIHQNQPPVGLWIKREGAYQLISWEQNPLNSKLEIMRYNIYRKRVGESDEGFQLIGNVSGDIFAYVDYVPNTEEKFVYAVTSVNTKGNESHKSKPMKEKKMQNSN